MSFSRAQRFSYRKPDIDVSPADYNVDTSSFNKGIIISKGSKFHENAENEGNPGCRRSCCCKKISEKTISFRSDSSDSLRDARYESSSNFSRNDFSRSSFRRKSTMKKTSTPKLEATKTIKDKSKNFTVISETHSKVNQLSDNEEFIDDDYHSYSSCEELDSLRRIEEYEYSQVCTAYAQLIEKQRASTSNFEKVMTKKLSNIERTMENFKRDFDEIRTKVNVEKISEVDQLRKQHDAEINKIENVRRYFDEVYNIPQSKYQGILEIIANSIKNLNKEFEYKRRSILKRSESRILELIDDFYDISNSSAKEINHLCNETALNMSKRLLDVLATPTSSNLSLASHCDTLLEKVQETFNEDHECFNYENICKLLSDKLQVTQDELQVLEEDNMDITLKYHDTQQALEAQSTMIEILHLELAKLKESVNNNERQLEQ